MTNKYEMDMCSGPLLGKILRFSLPLALTGILQLLYNAADVIVVGQYCGSTSLAAVGSTGALINLIVNVFMGLSVGANVVVARYYGAQDREGVHRAVHTAITVGAIAGIAVGIFGFFLSRSLLQLIDTPPDVIDKAALYMQIYFLGIPASMLYNFGSSILRATGDTKRPLYFLTVSGLINVVLNLVFVVFVHMDVAGVATATVISQVLSAALVIICLARTKGWSRLEFRRLRIYSGELIKIARIGLPAGIQGSIFSISNVLIQRSINGFNSTTIVAGNSIAANLEGFVYVAMNAISQAALTFTGQNFGAKQLTRIRRVLAQCMGVVFVLGFVLGMAFFLFGPVLLRLYNGDSEVIAAGMERLRVICSTYFLCGMMEVAVGSLRGIGYSLTPMLVSILGACGIRILWIYTVFAMDKQLFVLYCSYPVSWLITVSVHLLCFLFAWRRVKARLESQEIPACA